MENIKLRNWAWVAIMAASAVAVVFLNALAFGLSAKTIYDSLAHTAFMASSVSIFILGTAPRIERFRFPVRAAAILAGIVPATFVGLWLATIFLRFANPFEVAARLIPSFRTTIFSLVISYIFGFGGYLYLSSRGKLAAAKVLIRQKAEAEQKARTLAGEAQIASLESRIRPHFLFNTLNSIAALIREDPPAAERMVEQLSSILRYSLDKGSDHLVSLAQELEITKDYLEIQKSRFAERLDYSFDVDQSLMNRQVPTFSLHTLVENSIKHVAATTSGRTSVSVSAYRKDGHMVLRVDDSGHGFDQHNIKNGHGLHNLTERLRVIYGDTASVGIGSADQGSVSVLIPNNE